MNLRTPLYDFYFFLIKINSNIAAERPPNYVLRDFLLDMLREECNHDIISCIDEDQQSFTLIEKEEVAKLWEGEQFKQKPKMNYAKMSRGLRYYYQNKSINPQW